MASDTLQLLDGVQFNSYTRPCIGVFQVCSKEQQEVLDHGSKKSERLHDYLMKQTPSVTTTDDSVDDGLRKALEHRDRLLEYDKTRYDSYYQKY